ncbi:hypothetical protein CA262_16155 [Sphingobium sp. GW456-12-10-14-TSB1]|jgi:hypothetical protein|uniref:hypothetical protein n=1 Tax=Sphingobium sp. GW456-12-10-14-TSB1 TaxID=1987165 RepID=UPI000A3D00BD|nr:hypothetical protein [Sphingobium sp. GW456-12-10-14-TSB1]OUC56215.1 hypothetical protein CA262_16155 [Sphingobium sp. GW456-12-10-14-TSB1]|tara:strand:+ start:362 stop:1051 length:690 start_codon:yes stop_codon:yes gene_type:complete
MAGQAQQPSANGRARLVHLVILAVLELVMAGELVFLVLDERWLHVFLVLAIMITMMSPFILKPRWRSHIPFELQILAIIFVFATLFLGEVRDYYERFWWWDLLLHATAGLLLGLLGFMIVYILNEDQHVDLYMRPSFLALFAFFFSQGIGALWEIFEFAMDQIFGMTMQKPMLGDPSGLTDTMWDLIVNALGAAVISLGGLRYLIRVRSSYVDSWARRFIERNPQIFGD